MMMGDNIISLNNLIVSVTINTVNSPPVVRLAFSINKFIKHFSNIFNLFLKDLKIVSDHVLDELTVVSY